MNKFKVAQNYSHIARVFLSVARARDHVQSKRVWPRVWPRKTSRIKNCGMLLVLNHCSIHRETSSAIIRLLEKLNLSPNFLIHARIHVIDCILCKIRALHGKPLLQLITWITSSSFILE